MRSTTAYVMLAPAIASMLAPSSAFAHSGSAHVHGLLAGIEHPFTGIDHLLAIMAVGIIAGRTGGRALIVLPSCFVLAMLAGALLGIAGIGLPAVEPTIALSLVVLGSIMALAGPLPLAAAAALAAFFALFHGNSHGLEIPEAVNGVVYAAGFIASTAGLFAAGMLAALTQRRWPEAIRAAGIATALSGVALVAAAA
jgi:urease accessory protein